MSWKFYAIYALFYLESVHCDLALTSVVHTNDVAFQHVHGRSRRQSDAEPHCRPKAHVHHVHRQQHSTKQKKHDNNQQQRPVNNAHKTAQMPAYNSVLPHAQPAFGFSGLAIPGHSFNMPHTFVAPPFGLLPGPFPSSTHAFQPAHNNNHNNARQNKKTTVVQPTGQFKKPTHAGGVKSPTRKSMTQAASSTTTLPAPAVTATPPAQPVFVTVPTTTTAAKEATSAVSNTPVSTVAAAGYANTATQEAETEMSLPIDIRFG